LKNAKYHFIEAKIDKLTESSDITTGGSRGVKGDEAPLNFSDTFFDRWFLTQKRPLG